MDERNRDQQQGDEAADRDVRRGDEVPQDGMGRDAAHGGDTDDRYQGGSVGRNSGRAGDDLLGIDASGGTAAGGSAREASDSGGTDDATDRQRAMGARRAGAGGDDVDAGQGRDLQGGTDEGGRGATRDAVDLDDLGSVSRRDPTTR
jgi:hypothetical protein